MIEKTGTATPESLREPNRDRGSATHSPLSPGESLALSRESDSCISGGRLDGAPDMVLDPTETVPPPRDRKESGAEEIAIAEEAEADPPFEGAA